MSNETKRDVFVDAVDALADAQARGAAESNRKVKAL